MLCWDDDDDGVVAVVVAVVVVAVVGWMLVMSDWSFVSVSSVFVSGGVNGVNNVTAIIQQRPS